MNEAPTSPALAARHRRVAIACAAFVVLMVGMAYASVPLYRLFCQVTGFAGTTQRADQPSSQIGDRIITVRLDANVGPGLSWDFTPDTPTLDVRIGENMLAFYKVTNTGPHASVGSATFNVTPDQAGIFFNKMQCFCFTEQRVEPGETVEMPVSFFIDPAIARDKDGSWIRNITLSYTFYRVEHPRQSVRAAPAGSGEPGKGS